MSPSIIRSPAGRSRDRPGSARANLVVRAGGLVASAALLTCGTATAQGSPAATAPPPTAMPTPTAAPMPNSPTTPASGVHRGITSFSAAGDVVAAFRETDGGRLQLVVGTAAAQDVAPVPTLPGDRTDYPRPHVGSDADGHPVIVYPRCPDAVSRGRCDLYAYDVASRRERLLAGVRRPGRSEYEGVLSRGTLLFAARGSSRAADAGTGLWYRPAGGRERRIARNPGSDLALRGARIAHVIVDGGKGGEEPCDNSTLVVRSLGGKARALARTCLYPGYIPAGWTSPSFVGQELLWAQSFSSGPNVFRYDLRSGRVRQARTAPVLFAFQAVTADTALVLRFTGPVVSEQDGTAANVIEPLSPISWKPRQSSLLGDVPRTDPKPLA